jgi:hypothetical protein
MDARASVVRLLELHSGGEFDAAVELVDADIEMFPPGSQPAIRGRAALRAWMEPDAFLDQVIEPLEVIAVDDKVFTQLHIWARGARSGVELDLITWCVWTAGPDGLITRAEIFLEHEEAEARAAAGLSAERASEPDAQG